MKALFVIFNLTNGFFLGALVAGLTLPKQTGLEGGAIVFLYSIIGAVIGLTLGLILINKIKLALLKKITIGLIIFNIIFVAWIIFQVLSNLHEKEPMQKPPQRKTDPVTEPTGFLLPKNNEQTEAGLGMAISDFYDRRI